ncbi:hypothetical protein HWA77_19075 [Photobacterium damselae subsp. damselae]|uniref:Uncharacterized protein n=1 Tax=Photobacterium damselae subsp. damselae TaxID=85581 RepID=A0A850QUW0_PHODD|nr:hypothetical protein [Photobacterium damselae]NVP02322.1 hypothetical protein [Photobacterium damselae subsp. damselae]
MGNITFGYDVSLGILDYQSIDTKRPQVLLNLRPSQTFGLAKNELLLESNKELVVSTKTQNSELNAQIKQLNGEVVELSKTIIRLESAQESKRSAQEQNQQLDCDLRDTQQERSTLQASLSDAKSSLSINTWRLEQAQSEVVKLKTNVKQYLEMIRHYEGLLSKASNTAD